jgi:hypothetical protein
MLSPGTTRMANAPVHVIVSIHTPTMTLIILFLFFILDNLLPVTLFT